MINRRVYHFAAHNEKLTGTTSYTFILERFEYVEFTSEESPSYVKKQ